MHLHLLRAAITCLLAVCATAQITRFTAPAASGVDGAADCGFLSALGTGSAHYEDLESITTVTGMPPQLIFSHGGAGQEARLRHREGAGGALTGPYRAFAAIDFATPGGTNRGVRSQFGTAATPDMFEFTFTPTVAHWGAHCIDLESVVSDPGVIRAYNPAGTMIYEAPIHYPNNEDGKNATNNAINFIGIASTQTNIKKVTVQVGNSAAQVAMGNHNNENVHALGFVDFFYGRAAVSPNRLTTTFANNNLGSVGGAIYFDLTCTDPGGLTIDSLDLNFASSAGTSGSIDVYASLDGASWAGPLASGAVASAAGPGLPSHVVLSAGLPFDDGCHYEVAIVANGLQHAYTTGAAPLPLSYSNAALTLDAGRASNTPFTAPYFSPRVPNVVLYYSAGGTCPPLAAAEPQGNGCLSHHTSIYEAFTPTSLDLQSMLFGVNPGDDSVVLAHTAAPPLLAIGATGPATALALGDDSQVMAGTFGLSVGSNCFIATGTGNSNAFVYSPSTLLGNPARGFYSHKDLNPSAAGSGQVYYEEDTGSFFPRAVITYDGVYAFGTTDPNTVQFICDFVPTVPPELLQVQIVWGAMASSGGDLLVGYSPGGASGDPGAMDLSAITTPTQTDPSDLYLELSAVSRPVQGAVTVPFEVTVQNIPSSAILHLGLVGLANPMLPLDFLGMHGCTLYASLEVIVGPAFAPFGSSHTWSPLDLPALPPDFAGFEFYVQSVIAGTTLNHAFGLGQLTSNGLKCTVGTL